MFKNACEWATSLVWVSAKKTSANRARQKLSEKHERVLVSVAVCYNYDNKNQRSFCWLIPANDTLEIKTLNPLMDYYTFLLLKVERFW